MNITSGPVARFTLALLQAIDSIKNNKFDEYKKADEDEILLLMNNGCRISDKDVMQLSVYLGEQYYLNIITGMMGNDKNTFFDFYYTHTNADSNEQIKNLVVFSEYFKDVKTKEAPEFDENGIRDITGNSNFFFALKQLTELFVMSYYNPATFTGIFNSTVAGTNFRYLPCLVAGAILMQFKPLTEEDTEGCGIEHSIIAEILSNSNITMDHVFAGIRYNDDK